MHSIAESYAEPRVPGGASYMSVATRVSTVRVVYMQRFLNELLEYLSGGARTRPGSSGNECFFGGRGGRRAALMSNRAERLALAAAQPARDQAAAAACASPLRLQ